VAWAFSPQTIDSRLPLPAGGVLISGRLDLDPRSTSIQSNRQYDFVTRLGIRSMAKRFAPVADHRNPLVSLSKKGAPRSGEFGEFVKDLTAD